MKERLEIKMLLFTVGLKASRLPGSPKFILLVSFQEF